MSEEAEEKEEREEREETVLMVRDPSKNRTRYFSCGGLDKYLDTALDEFQVPKSQVEWHRNYGHLILPEHLKPEEVAEVKEVPQIPLPKPEHVEVIGAEEDL
jgi:hypothetical protein